jgi:DNA-binding transcriptional regulator YhcF (GntR family)
MNHVEQNLTNEIVALLLKEDLHTRAIAERLASNHATVLRKLRDLSEDNIVDFRDGGEENKVYTLKKSIEGRNAAITAEMYKQSMAVSRYPVLRASSGPVQDMPEIRSPCYTGAMQKGSRKKTAISTSSSNTEYHPEETARTAEFIAECEDRGIRYQEPAHPEIIKDHIIIKGVEVYFDKTGFF